MGNKKTKTAPTCTACYGSPCHAVWATCMATETEIHNVAGERIGWVVRTPGGFDAIDARDLPLGTFAKWAEACWRVTQ